MKTMRLPITIYRDEEGWFVVECPVIPGCMSQGATETQALDNIREAMQLCLQVRQEQGLPATIESREIEIPVYAWASKDLGSRGCASIRKGGVGNGSPAR